MSVTHFRARRFRKIFFSPISFNHSPSKYSILYHFQGALDEYKECYELNSNGDEETKRKINQHFFVEWMWRAKFAGPSAACDFKNGPRCWEETSSSSTQGHDGEPSVGEREREQERHTSTIRERAKAIAATLLEPLEEVCRGDVSFAAFRIASWQRSARLGDEDPFKGWVFRVHLLFMYSRAPRRSILSTPVPGLHELEADADRRGRFDHAV